ncbi:MAG: DNA polymerase III subunit gamma/tau [bacterium]|nr:DNA polymerase III subunit gamma/tau [bacterium]
MVFYRKYRPQKIDELDSEEIRTKLTAILSGKNLPHAFIFTGPKGLGKTSTARIVAKAVNCERLASSKVASSSAKLNAKRYSLDAEVEPCNKCSQCISITNGTNLDILEIDGASNRGIDEIRDLREKIRLLPVSASKKVYIIDEVHMLTTEAFNALLKTLEEPPSHAIFILCTTEQQKVPATILSRCFHLNFKLATKEELLRSFKRIAKDEKLSIDNEALEFLSSLSDGSFRDGVKILEELTLLSDGKKITKELIEKKYQVSGIKYQVEQMIESLVQKDVKNALKMVSGIVGQGMDIKYFITRMIDILHQDLLSKAGVVRNQESGIRNQEFTMEEIKKLIELLTKAYGEIKFAVLPQLPLELMIIEWGSKTQNQAEHKALDNSSTSSINTEPSGTPVQRSSASGSAAFSDKKMESTKDDNYGETWKKLIDLVKVHNQSIAGVLRGCSLKKFDGKKFIIEAGYKFHKEKLEERKALSILEKAVEEIVGPKVEVSIVLREKR